MAWQRFRCQMDCTKDAAGRVNCVSEELFRSVADGALPPHPTHLTAPATDASVGHHSRRLTLTAAALAAMVSEGFLAAGYNFVSVDSCWAERERDERGHVCVHPSSAPTCPLA